MKEIILTNGSVCLVDDEDYGYLSQFRWFMKSGGYAQHEFNINGKRKKVLMHRLLTDAPKGYEVDHINHDPLDNRRANLRICTPSQNQRNRRIVRGFSKFKGVFPSNDKRKNGDITQRWKAKICIDYRNISLGSFPFTPEGEIEAARAYDMAAIELFGEFALTNEAMGLFK